MRDNVRTIRLTCAVIMMSLPVAAQVPSTRGAVLSPSAGTPREIARTYQLQSAALGEERTIDVSLPPSYANGNQSYPLVVVLDGESLQSLTAALSRYYGSVGELPELIVVGVRNTSRMRDLSTAPQPGYRPPGGADFGGASRFEAFLVNELVPELQRSYRTQPFRVLIGHSLAGLTALDMISRYPAAFGGYVVLDPSIWYNDGYEWREVQRALATAPLRHTRIILVRTPAFPADTTTRGGRAPMVRFLGADGESHVAMPVAGISKALREIFRDFAPAEWLPWNRPITLLSSADSLSARLGYDVPIPEGMMSRAFKWSLDGRYWDDAERIRARVAQMSGWERIAVQMAQQLAAARAGPLSANFIPLAFAAARPSASTARRLGLLGTWRGSIVRQPPQVSTDMELEFVASGDTVIMRTRTTVSGGGTREGTLPIIQLTLEGLLEWAFPLRGLPGVEAYSGRVADGTRLEGTLEFRGVMTPDGRDPRDSGTRFGFRKVSGATP